MLAVEKVLHNLRFANEPAPIHGEFQSGNPGYALFNRYKKANKTLFKHIFGGNIYPSLTEFSGYVCYAADNPQHTKMKVAIYDGILKRKVKEM